MYVRGHKNSLKEKTEIKNKNVSSWTLHLAFEARIEQNNNSLGLEGVRSSPMKKSRSLATHPLNLLLHQV